MYTFLDTLEAAAAPKFAHAHREFDRFTDDEREFIAARDSFYLSTVAANGWPYIQHRGGPPGFLKVLDDKTLGFADFRGNRQHISVGNLANNDRASLFLVDYPHRARLKILAHARISEDPEILERLKDPTYKAVIERAMLFDLVAFDWNCPQHITPRWTAEEIRHASGM